MRPLLSALFVLLLAAPALGFSPEEQRELLDETLARLAAELDGSYEGARLELGGPTGDRVVVEIGDAGFGALAAASVSDLDPGRQHPLGATLSSELAAIEAEDLQRFLERDTDEAPGSSVSARYLAHHWRALRLAAEARGQSEDARAAGLQRALREEAIALSHLMDAFSSAHFFHPGPDLFDWLHRTNSRERHNTLRFLGAYMMDSRGEVWQGFGDGLLHWHSTSRERVAAAVADALKEFFAVYFAPREPPVLGDWLEAQGGAEDSAAWVDSWLEARNGRDYYEELRMPSLLRVPMELRASWSERDPSRIEHGVAARRHWPQLREEGAHDPYLPTEVVAALPSAEEMPVWLRFPRLESSSPRRLILEDPEAASVRWVQVRRIPPTFRGGLLVLGGGLDFEREGTDPMLSAGLGWGLVDRLLPLRRLPNFQRTSVELRARWNLRAAESMGVLVLAGQLEAPRLPGSLHLELGLADGWQGSRTGWGLHMGVGLATASGRLPGVYAGGLLRLRYSVSYVGEAAHALLLDVLVH